jgi:hypothetical protein
VVALALRFVPLRLEDAKTEVLSGHEFVAKTSSFLQPVLEPHPLSTTIIQYLGRRYTPSLFEYPAEEHMHVVAGVSSGRLLKAPTTYGLALVR